MSSRSRYLVTYDISDPARLRLVHRTVLDYGTCLQYSVYVCELTPVERVGLRRELRAAMHREDDAVSIFDLGPPTGNVWQRVEYLGRQPRLGDDGPAIW